MTVIIVVISMIVVIIVVIVVLIESSQLGRESRNGRQALSDRLYFLVCLCLFKQQCLYYYRSIYRFIHFNIIIVIVVIIIISSIIITISIGLLSFV